MRLPGQQGRDADLWVGTVHWRCVPNPGAPPSPEADTPRLSPLRRLNGFRDWIQQLDAC